MTSHQIVLLAVARHCSDKKRVHAGGNGGGRAAWRNVALAKCRIALARWRIAPCKRGIALAKLRIALAKLGIALDECRIALAKLGIPLAKLGIAPAQFRIALAECGVFPKEKCAIPGERGSAGGGEDPDALLALPVTAHRPPPTAH